MYSNCQFIHFPHFLTEWDWPSERDSARFILISNNTFFKSSVNSVMPLIFSTVTDRHIGMFLSLSLSLFHRLLTSQEKFVVQNYIFVVFFGWALKYTQKHANSFWRYSRVYQVLSWCQQFFYVHVLWGWSIQECRQEIVSVPQVQVFFTIQLIHFFNNFFGTYNLHIKLI